MDMKIISLNITEFGGLSDFSLDLSEGLNVIRGKNESGKSTLLLFVMYMLYGMPKTVRKGTPGAFDKDRSLSRRSQKAQGSMEVECGGVRYRIERTNLRRGKNSEVTVSDLATGERVFSGQEPGEALLGVSRETFESCLWCAQARSFVINSEGVRDTLSNLSLTADESVNGDKVLKTIREERKRYKLEKGQGGLIYEADLRVSAARERIKQIDDAMVRTADRREAAERLEAEMLEAESKMKKAELLRKLDSKLSVIERFDRLTSLEREIEDLEIKKRALAERYQVAKYSPDGETLYTLKNLRSTLAKRREELEAAKSLGTRASNVDKGAIEIAERISEREGEQGFIERIKRALDKAKKQKTLAGVLLAAALVTVIIRAIFYIPPILFAFAAGAFAAGTFMLLSASRALSGCEAELREIGTDKDSYERFVASAFTQWRIYSAEQNARLVYEEKRVAAEHIFESAQNECSIFFAKFGLEYSDEAAERLASEIYEYLGESAKIEREISIKSGLAASEREALRKYDEAQIRSDMPSEEVRAGLDMANADEEYAIANAQYKSAEAKLSALRIQIATEGFDADARADAVAELEAAKAEKRGYAKRFEVLDRAYEAVSEAYDNMRRNFAPKIRERAGAYLSEISEGRYKKVMLSEDMEISIEDTGEEVAVGTLSSGTADAVYMALRMSLIENIFEGAVPLFLDESLSQLDDGRAESVLKMIDRFTNEGSQCLLFTCHSREESLCERIGVDFNLIELSND